eukprot:1868929-Pleurochrysis_carterae.AAC.1
MQARGEPQAVTPGSDNSSHGTTYLPRTRRLDASVWSSTTMHQLRTGMIEAGRAAVANQLWTLTLRPQ